LPTCKSQRSPSRILSALSNWYQLGDPSTQYSAVKERRRAYARGANASHRDRRSPTVRTCSEACQAPAALF
jgi:hypothetical protein